MFLKEIPDLSEIDKIRFWSFTHKKSEDKCWPWLGGIGNKGYGNFSLKRKSYTATRVMYKVAYNIDPDDKFVCHQCHNRCCVNPKHLYLGTNSDNMQDMFLAGRKSHVGSNHNRTNLTEEIVLEIRKCIDNGEQNKDIAYKYATNAQIIADIKRRKSWVHI